MNRARGFGVLLFATFLFSAVAYGLTIALTSGSRLSTDVSQQFDTLRASFLAESGMEYARGYIAYFSISGCQQLDMATTTQSAWKTSFATRGISSEAVTTSNNGDNACTVTVKGTVGTAIRALRLAGSYKTDNGYVDRACTYPLRVSNNLTESNVAIPGFALFHVAYEFKDTASTALPGCPGTSPSAVSTCTSAGCLTNANWTVSSGSGQGSLGATGVAAPVLANSSKDIQVDLREPSGSNPALVARDGVITGILLPASGTNEDIFRGEWFRSLVSTSPLTLPNGANPTVTPAWCRYPTTADQATKGPDVLILAINGFLGGLNPSLASYSVAFDSAVQNSQSGRLGPNPANVVLNEVSKYPYLSATPNETFGGNFDNSVIGAIHYRYNRYFYAENVVSNTTVSDPKYRRVITVTGSSTTLTEGTYVKVISPKAPIGTGNITQTYTYGRFKPRTKVKFAGSGSGGSARSVSYCGQTMSLSAGEYLLVSEDANGIEIACTQAAPDASRAIEGDLERLSFAANTANKNSPNGAVIFYKSSKTLIQIPQEQVANPTALQGMRVVVSSNASALPIDAVIVQRNTPVNLGTTKNPLWVEEFEVDSGTTSASSQDIAFTLTDLGGVCGGVCAFFRERDPWDRTEPTTQVSVTRVYTGGTTWSGAWVGGAYCARIGDASAANIRKVVISKLSGLSVTELVTE